MAGTETRPRAWTSWVIVLIVLMLILGIFLLASRYLIT